MVDAARRPIVHLDSHTPKTTNTRLRYVNRQPVGRIIRV
jgi:hypothetical protein